MVTGSSTRPSRTTSKRNHLRSNPCFMYSANQYGPRGGCEKVALGIDSCSRSLCAAIEQAPHARELHALRRLGPHHWAKRLDSHAIITQENTWAHEKRDLMALVESQTGSDMQLMVSSTRVCMCYCCCVMCILHTVPSVQPLAGTLTGTPRCNQQATSGVEWLADSSERG